MKTTDYTVQPGDTLWSIAGKQCGDNFLWPRLAWMNRDRIVDADLIRPGDVLRLPCRETP